ncbi:Anaerobic nitric oxide reductase transcription regulator NorR [Sodalis praecaptivus]
MRALTAREQQLKQELAATARKLQNLTDIERRLSSRKWQTPDDDGPAASDGGSGKPPRSERQTAKGDGTSAPDGGAAAPCRGRLSACCGAGGRGATPMRTRKHANLLLVDDDTSLLKLLGMRLTSEGFTVTTAENGPEALRQLLRNKIDLVISDLRMDEMDGIALFKAIQQQQPGLPVIILTAHGSIPEAVSATQEGVFSFLTKPVDRDALYRAIDAALALTQPASDERWREAIVTRSPLMLRLLEQAKMVAQSDVSILLSGQSGTGKEILAKAIHAASPRAHAPFVAINCGALPEPLLESELFGHARGAFTGAVSQREGLFQAADGGTLFLDEIGDMPLSLQVKLLRVLQERKVRPLGSDRAIDVRILSATHRDLPKAMAAGSSARISIID